jgi:uncharacterized protein (DUF1501 family)
MSATRRDFLKSGLSAATLVSLGPAVPTFLTRTALAAAPRREAQDTILIVVQLAGGNDGLNTVVPFDNDDYGRNRDTLRLKAGEVLKITDSLGFHPRMAGFRRLYQEGHLTVVQGVGYANPHGGHEESMRYWQTARPHEPGCQTGWLGRTADVLAGAQQPVVPAVFVGEIPQPFTLNARRSIVPSIRSAEACQLHVPAGTTSASQQRRIVEEAAKLPRSPDANPLLNFLQRSTLAAYTDVKQVEEATRARTPIRTGGYPQIPLAQMFRLVAQLIRADLGIRIFCTELGGAEPGGFDNHAAQRDNHAALLHQLSESVAALVDDLRQDKLLDRVLLMTFSEFGRTLVENGRRGTDHGSAAPLFLVGGRVKGGLIGPHPSLTELENGGPKFHTDFRRVYATALERWLGIDSQSILLDKFEPLELLA